MSLLFVQSIDYTRTRLGVDARNPAGQRQFNGIMDCYIKTIKADGLRGLYRGFWISCSCIFIYRGLYFGLYDTIKPIGMIFLELFHANDCINFSIICQQRLDLHILARMGRHYRVWHLSLPLGHSQETHDDDGGPGGEVLQFLGLRQGADSKRRSKGFFQGGGSQHCERCGGCWSPIRQRQTQENLH